ncbi:putative serine dehydratase domain-containing protein [Xylariomycetidae sp. FL0641]|nr:putative serine dehydratase domain-containing protein [Xylariomycetidae sp. FL0641]
MNIQLSKELLRTQYVGKTLNQVVTPAVVLDLAKVEANCNLMLEAAQRLQLSWRAHIKTHKTEELTRLQVGDDSSAPVNLIVSTVVEAESVLPLLKEYQEKGRQVNVLYSFPIYASCVDRLAAVSAALGPGGLTVMVDHADQAKHLTALASKSGNRPLVFLKINVGSDRAGVYGDAPACAALVGQLLLSETVGSSVFLGLYTHAGHSYAARRDWEAMGVLGDEFAALRDVAAAVRRERPGHPLVLSVGATPTATTLQHPDFDDVTTPPAAGREGAVLGDAATTASRTARLKALIAGMRADGLTLEVHAGVYPTLDLQQLAAHARDATYLNWAAVGISVLADVASVYPGRGPGGATEALVNAGCLALGREPCEDRGPAPGVHYGAWGLVMPWGGTLSSDAAAYPVPGPDFPAVHAGWQVAKLSQEHGVLRWVPGAAGHQEVPLHVGQRVRIWPNHSCITGAGHGWYLVVDSRNAGREDEVVDVWPRWNGW